MTKLLFSNLVKGYYTNVQQEETRVIDVNEILEKRLEALNIQTQPEGEEMPEGFVEGLDTDMVDALFSEDGTSSNVIKGNSQDEEANLEAVNNQAKHILAQAQEEAQRIREEARILAEKDAGTILDKARTQGYEQGRKKALEEVQKMEQKLQQHAIELEEEYQKQIKEYEPRFIDIITGIYEHIFEVDLQSYREIIVHLITTTMRGAEGSKDFMVHVSKEDYPYVSMQKKQIIAGAGAGSNSVEIIEDATLNKNECFIETEGGIFDCSLGTQLSELRKKLMLLSYEQE